MIKEKIKKLGVYIILLTIVSFSFVNAKKLTVALMDDPISLDPQYMSGMWEYRLLINMFEGLVGFDPEGNIAPAVAESWKVSADGKTYTFKLRQDVKWSDGKQLTAKDFEFAYKRILNPATAAPYASLLYDIQGAEDYNAGKTKENSVAVKAVNDYTLEIKLKKAEAFFITMLEHPAFYPIPAHVVQKYGKDWVKLENMVFNGAYKIKKYTPKSSIEAVRNEQYYNNLETKIDEVLFLTSNDVNAMLESFRAKQVDISYDFPAQRIDWVKKNLMQEYNIEAISGLLYLSMNVRPDSKSPFKDKRVRRALALAIDREFLVEKILKTGEVPAYGYVPPSLYGKSGANPELDFVELTKDQRLAEAKKLLEEAGYNANNPLKFEFAYNTNDENKLIAVALASMLKPLNIEFTQVVAESNVHYANLQKGSFTFGRARWIADYQDPSTFLYLFQKGVPYNFGAYDNKEYDDLVEQAKTVLDTKQRINMYKKAEKIVLKDIPAIPLFYLVNKMLVSKKVVNFMPNISGVYKIQYLDLVD